MKIDFWNLNVSVVVCSKVVLWIQNQNFWAETKCKHSLQRVDLTEQRKVKAAEATGRKR